VAERKWFKGPAGLAVDAWYSSGSVRANLEQARDLLQQNVPFASIVSQLGSLDRGRPEFVYPLEQSILQGTEFESVARHGYLEAIGLALVVHSPPVPIKTYWMTGAGNDKFEMHIADEANQVSVTLLVPQVEGGSMDPGYPEAWVVSIDAAGHQQTKKTSGPPNLPRPSERTRPAAR
jgi:hypothetical protein